jgi:hypothetical protein
MIEPLKGILAVSVFLAVGHSLEETSPAQTTLNHQVQMLLGRMDACTEAEVQAAVSRVPMVHVEENATASASVAGTGMEAKTANVQLLKSGVGGLRGFCRAVAKAVSLGLSAEGDGWCAPKRLCESDALYLEREPHAWVTSESEWVTSRNGVRRRIRQGGALVKLCGDQRAAASVGGVCIVLDAGEWVLPARAVYTRHEPLVYLSEEDGQLVVTRLATPD